MKNKDIIDQAKNICKSRVQYPKDTRSQNTFEFVEQKKEMFLVQLSHNTIKSEIDLLSEKLNRKKEALENSAKLLNDDERVVRTYVMNDNNETKELESTAEKKQKERKDKEEMLKEIESQIQNFNSDMIKHRDTLENLEKHKIFLHNLSDSSFIEEQERIKQMKTQILLDKYLKENLEKSKAGDSKEKERISKEFYEKLENYLIDVPQDFYHEEIQFKDPEEISEKFTELETSNLFLIHNRQEVEQGFEELKTEERQMIEDLSHKKRAYEKNLEKLENATKDSSEVYKKAGLVIGSVHFKDGKNYVEDGQEVFNVTELLTNLRKEIERTYKVIKGDNADLSAKENVDILSEIESAMDLKISKIDLIRNINENKVKGFEKSQRRKRKEEKQKELSEKVAKDYLEK